ncbi:MAG: T9SS type A sorting domain-containing protein [Bacteroidales bacterium]|nr:T9SS type A sorting domain-containing protein [Bacteroidales bacterium]
MKKKHSYFFIFLIWIQLMPLFIIAQLDPPNLVNEFTSNACSPYLSFVGVEEAVKYEIQVSLDNSFITDVFIDYTESTTYYLPLLEFDKEYFLRARAINDTDTSIWSDTISRVTISRGVVDVEINQDGNLIATEDRLYCSIERWWEVDTIGSFNSPILFRDTTFDENYILVHEPFYFCSDYYFRVKCISLIDTTPAWSQHLFNSISIPCSPTLVSPNNFNFTNSITNLKLERYDHPLRYVFELDTTIDFTNPREFEIADTDDSDLVSVGDLYFEKQHYWRARAINPIDTSQWSDIFTFSMCGVHQTLPLDEEINISTNPSLSVVTIGNIIGYHFELDTVPDFSSEMFMQYDSPNSAINLENLLFGTTYYWRVRVYHSLDTSSYTSVRSFTTVLAPALISPPDLSVNQNLKLNLRAGFLSGVTKYQYQLSQSLNFLPQQTTLLEHNNFANMVQTDLLHFGIEYYWRARYINENDTSAWSTAFSFVTIAKPQLIEPTDQATQMPINNCMLYWQNIQYVDSYTLWISTTPDFTEYEEYLQPFYGNIIYLSELLPSTTYYWKVKAITSSGESNWSETWSFTTQNTSKSDLLDQDYNFQIFPNPSSNDFTVKVTLPNYNNAEIKIAGLNGHLKDIISVTSETTVIPTKGWKPGVYVCNLFIDGKLVKTEKLVYE